MDDLHSATHMSPTIDLKAAGRVKADSLEPRQLRLSSRQKTACNLYLQHMCKFVGTAEFASKAEHLYAGLLEGDPHVRCYIPHPFRLRVGPDVIMPDTYVVSDDAQPQVIVLRAPEKFDAALSTPLTDYLAQHRLRFVLLDPDSVFVRQQEAENWLEIVRILHRCRAWDTTVAELQLLERFYAQGVVALGDIAHAHRREANMSQEIALFRLLHRGQVRAQLNNAPLGYHTDFNLCD